MGRILGGGHDRPCAALQFLKKMWLGLHHADFNGILIRWAPEAHAALTLLFVRLRNQKAHEYVAYTDEGETDECGRENFGEWGEHLGDLSSLRRRASIFAGAKKEARFCFV